ncbi:hypothetical protein ACFOY8_14175 [Thalassospira xianhensis]|uniref:Uncharacterized protein n=1 Tax=Thalassospira xianhensis MCCC 1A02616 TaxID=1177929 RepID=A0A367UHB5_9PROT|nr:hypothetical protein [Thalassospira xianhensis]RCK07697.1 hypothetical protein TH5_01090 [Thalassospira xianhensis MCCC 1A02616]
MEFRGQINKNDVVIEVDVADGTELDELIRDVINTKVVSDEIHRIAAHSYPSKYALAGPSDGFGQKTLAKIAEAALDAAAVLLTSEDDDAPLPEHAASDYIATDREEFDLGYYEDFFQNHVKSDRDTKSLFSFFTDVVFEDAGYSNRDIDNLDVLDEIMQEKFAEALAEADDSSPLDLIRSRDEVEICYIPEGGKYAIDDIQTSYTSVCSSSVDVRPDENFARVLAFFGWTAEEFKAAVKEATGDDLAAQPLIEDFEDGDQRFADYRFRQATELAEMWKNLETNNVRPVKLLNYDKLTEVLDNATYGGVPVFACRIKVEQLIKHDWSKDMRITGGGEVGLHDFCNGSGHIVDWAGTEFILPPVPGDWRVTEGNSYGIDGVYGIVHSYHRVDIEAVEPKPDVEPEVPELAGPSM